MTSESKLTILYPEPNEHDDETPAEIENHVPCRHWKVRIDREARRIYCKGCGGEVDPFTIVLRWAEDWSRITTWREEAERRRARAQERLAEILRLEKNARARLKKLDPQAKPLEKPWGENERVIR